MGGSFRVGLRADDVAAAMTFYRGLGFKEVAAIPSPDGEPMLGILERGDAGLVVDALVGLPFPDSERERQVQRGPRGLGVVIGVEVDDLEAVYSYCKTAGCTITSEPMEEAWGERLFTCVDPFGYEWKLSVSVRSVEQTEAIEATQARWFGPAD